MASEEDIYDELCAYTLAHRGPMFLHQHVVDAFAAQHANEQTKPIQLTFGLVGLYLHLERQFSGRQVQRAHTRLAQHPRTWPTFSLPTNRGAITAAEVLAEPAGPERDAAIDTWCAAVWEAYSDNRLVVMELLKHYAIA
jgi:Family of unknown function (DUF5946)